ncbi:MAG TPA: hypothetical protein VHT50_02955 [Mycobacterium sp.]|jgi:hypothetical protein|nr:hypothetical protein [Mycobacterium sp.]
MAISATGTVAHHKARVAGLTIGVKTGKRQPDDPELEAAYRDLNAANLEAAVKKSLATAHRPTDEQLARIVALLKAGA